MYAATAPALGCLWFAFAASWLERRDSVWRFVELEQQPERPLARRFWTLDGGRAHVL